MEFFNEILRIFRIFQDNLEDFLCISGIFRIFQDFFEFFNEISRIFRIFQDNLEDFWWFSGIFKDFSGLFKPILSIFLGFLRFFISTTHIYKIEILEILAHQLDGGIWIKKFPSAIYERATNGSKRQIETNWESGWLRYSSLCVNSQLESLFALLRFLRLVDDWISTVSECGGWMKQVNLQC